MTEALDDRARLAALLRSLNYEVDDGVYGEKSLRITTSGLNVTVIVYDDGSLTFVCSADGAGVNLRLEEVNEANNRVRFAKFSVDGSTLLLEADFMFSLDDPNAAEEIAQIMSLWKLALQELKHLVTELLQEP